MTNLRIAFAGTPLFARTILEQLCATEFRPMLVLTQPDRPKGRGRTLQASAVKEFAESQQLPLFQPERLLDPESIAPIKDLSLDVLIVAAYGLILPPAVLQLPRFGCINVHASLLPRWRGAAPIERAIMAGDQHTGVCIMQMDEGLDTGPVLSSKGIAITAEDTAITLEQSLAEQGAQLLISTLRELPVDPQPQPTTGANYAPKLTASDRIIDWSRSAAELHLQVRALSDRMPVRCEVNNVVMQILQTANLPQEDSKRAAAPGTITACTKNGITVQCGAGELVITRLKLNKGKGLAMHAADALNGYGEILHTGALIDSATRTS
jgi:methionyl-tRNA formyltransferase